MVLYNLKADAYYTYTHIQSLNKKLSVLHHVKTLPISWQSISHIRIYSTWMIAIS